MSWLSKVSDFAGKAEEMLVKLDQNAGDAIATTKKKSTGSSTSLNRNHPSSSAITEQYGGREPSQSHSDFVRPQRQPTSGYAPSTSVLPEHRDAHLISFLNEPGNEEAETRRSTFSTHSITEAADMPGTLTNLRSQLAAKDSQITVIRTKCDDLERRVEVEKGKAKKAAAALAKLQESIGSAETTSTPDSSTTTSDVLMKENNSLKDELSNARKRVASVEEQLAAVNHHLRLAKFNLTENKKEFDEYKDKAQKILHTKERLIDSLKAESGGEETSNSVLLAQIEELTLERDLARSDLESAQVQVYNMRAEADEMDTTSREAKTEARDWRRRLEEERDAWNVSHSILVQKAECARSEVDVIRREWEKERAAWQHKMDTKDIEMASLVDNARRTSSASHDRDDSGRMTTLLLQKEDELREAVREKQIMSVKLERAMRAGKETALPMVDSGVGGGASQSNGGSAVQAVLVKGLNTLRGNRLARTYFAAYLLAVHLLLFFIILTYTPESHAGHYSPPSPSTH